jgi:two-component system, chemotaxis family, protein-glutamate methylesterase/glutaminase
VNADIVARLRAQAPALVAIGASAGAVEALQGLLPAIPTGIPAAIVIVVHVPAARRSHLPAIFADACALRTCEAEDKAALEPGTVYFAPSDYHLLVERGGTLALSIDEPVNFSRPSIDVLFESAARACGPRALGILLSGASADGAAGLAAMAASGGVTWVQTPASARVPTMPRAALAKAPHVTLDPEDMGRALAEWTCT